MTNLSVSVSASKSDPRTDSVSVSAAGSTTVALAVAKGTVSEPHAIGTSVTLTRNAGTSTFRFGVIAVFGVLCWALAATSLLSLSSERKSRVNAVRDIICDSFRVNSGVFDTFIQMYDMNIENEKSFVAVTQSNPNIYMARLINATGWEKLRVSKFTGETLTVAQKETDKSNRYYYTDIAARAAGETLVSLLDLHYDKGKPIEPLTLGTVWQ
jgi:hypothetical protein